MKPKVYAEQVSENTYRLVDKYGSTCDENGELMYHPVFISGKANESEWPVYEKEKRPE